MKQYKSFKEFYPYYLSQHQNKTCRCLHFIGFSLALIFILFFLFTCNLWWLFWAVIAGYGLAWIGHAFFEKNVPATFSYPLYSLMGDFHMFKDIITGKIRFL